MGEVCRDKHGGGAAEGEPEWATVMARLWPHLEALDIPPYGPGHSPREAANALVQRFAALPEPKDPALTHAIADTITALGFHRLGSKLKLRCPDVDIEITLDNRVRAYRVKAPKHEHFLHWMQRMPGRRWDADKLVNVIPVDCRRGLYEALRSCFPGKLVRGPKGVFRIA